MELTNPEPELDSTDELSWSIRPGAENPSKVVVVFVIALSAGVLVTAVTKSPLLGLIGTAAVLGSTAEFWLGTTFRLGKLEATRRCGLSLFGIRWEDVKLVRLQGSEIRLSPLTEEGKWSEFRGVRIRTLPQNREQALSLIKAKVGADVGFLE